MGKLILIVEDDGDIHAMLCDLLTDAGYKTQSAFSGTEAVLLSKRERFDLVLLDYMLPGLNGKDTLARIREQHRMPVIALSAVPDTATKVAMLGAGADDYVVKPFDTEELLARIEAHLRRAAAQGESSDVLVYKDIVLNPEAFSVTAADRPVSLTKLEYGILELLMRHPGKVFTKENLFHTVWGEDFLGEDNTVNVHISNLRGKLAHCNPNEEYIRTVWGIGFKLA